MCHGRGFLRTVLSVLTFPGNQLISYTHGRFSEGTCWWEVNIVFAMKTIKTLVRFSTSQSPALGKITSQGMIGGMYRSRNESVGSNPATPMPGTCSPKVLRSRGMVSKSRPGAGQMQMARLGGERSWDMTSIAPDGMLNNWVIPTAHFTNMFLEQTNDSTGRHQISLESGYKADACSER